MPALYAGIDGGQSSTIAVVLDARGTVLGRGTAGPSDHVDEPANTQRAAQACESALAAAPMTQAGSWAFGNFYKLRRSATISGVTCPRLPPKCATT